jgi:hypothetical protein
VLSGVRFVLERPTSTSRHSQPANTLQVDICQRVDHAGAFRDTRCMPRPGRAPTARKLPATDESGAGGSGVVTERVDEPVELPSNVRGTRLLVATIGAVAAGLLIASCFNTWWTVEDWEREETIEVGLDSSLVWMILGFGLGCAALAVAGLANGGSEWMALALVPAWPLVAMAHFLATGETIDSDATGEAGMGLALATTAMILLTCAAVVAFLALAVGRAAKRAAGEP